MTMKVTMTSDDDEDDNDGISHACDAGANNDFDNDYTLENHVQTPPSKLTPRLLNSYLKIDISGSGTVRGSLNPLPFLPTVENDLPTVSVKLSPRLLNFYLKLDIFKLGPVRDSPTTPPPPSTAPRKRPPTTGLQIYSPAIKVLFEN